MSHTEEHRPAQGDGLVQAMRQVPAMFFAEAFSLTRYAFSCWVWIFLGVWIFFGMWIFFGVWILVRVLTSGHASCEHCMCSSPRTMNALATVGASSVGADTCTLVSLFLIVCQQQETLCTGQKRGSKCARETLTLTAQLHWKNSFNCWYALLL